MLKFPDAKIAGMTMPNWMKSPRQLERVKQRLRQQIALRKLQTGDILVYRPSNFIQKVIQNVTGQPYGHAALVDKENGVYYDTTMRTGGQAVPLKELTKSNLGENIDVLRPRLRSDIRSRAAENARRMVESMRGPLNYGYGNLMKAFYHIRDRKNITGSMKEIDPETAKTCAELIYSAYELAGADLGDRDPAMVSPGDFVETKKITPLGTIKGRKPKV
jgi:hypothetical protein